MKDKFGSKSKMEPYFLEKLSYSIIRKEVTVSGRRMLDVQIDVGHHFFLLIKCSFLYIDESLDEKVFVVSGILANSEKDLLLVYSQFKKQIMSIPMTKKQKRECYI